MLDHQSESDRVIICTDKNIENNNQLYLRCLVTKTPFVLHVPSTFNESDNSYHVEKITELTLKPSDR
eukprot:UN14277